MKIFNKAIILVLAVSFLFSLTACENQDVIVPDGMQIASEENEQYYLFVPKSWTLSQGKTSGAYFSALDKSNVSVSAYLADVTMLDIDSFWEKTENEYKTYFSQGYELVTSGASAKLGDTDAKKYEFKATLGNEKYMISEVIAQKNDIFYVFTYTALEDRYATHLSEVETIMNNFLFK